MFPLCPHQACRGGKFDYGVESETTDGPPSTDSTAIESTATDDEKVKNVMEQQVSEAG